MLTASVAILFPSTSLTDFILLSTGAAKTHFTFPKPLFNLQDAKGKVWIGVKEQLPVQVEGNMRVGKCIMTMLNNLNLHEFNTLGDYNIKLDGSIFNTSVPDGYTELTLTDILSVVPASVKAGAAGAGLSIILTPAGVISWRRHKRKKMIQVKKY